MKNDYIINLDAFVKVHNYLFKCIICFVLLVYNYLFKCIICFVLLQVLLEIYIYDYPNVGTGALQMFGVIELFVGLSLILLILVEIMEFIIIIRAKRASKPIKYDFSYQQYNISSPIISAALVMGMTGIISLLIKYIFKTSVEVAEESLAFPMQYADVISNFIGVLFITTVILVSIKMILCYFWGEKQEPQIK